MPVRRRRRFAAALTTTAALTTVAALLAGCGGAGDGGERKLVLYSGRDEKLIAPIIEDFEKRSGVEVEVRYGDSAEMSAQLVEEGRDTPADVFYSQEVGAVGVLAKRDLLAALPQATLDKVDERFRPASGRRWVGVTGRSRIILYNPRLVQEHGLDVPEGVEDLTDEQYKGKVGMVPSNPGFQAFITAFRVSEGERAAKRWLQDMQRNDADFGFESNIAALNAVQKGELPIALINHYYWARHPKRDSMEARAVFPKGDDPGGLVNATAVAITRTGSDDPNAQKLVDFLLSKRGQEDFVEETWEYPLVDGVRDPKGIPGLDSLQGPKLDLTDLDSLERTQRLLTDLGLLS